MCVVDSKETIIKLIGLFTLLCIQVSIYFTCNMQFLINEGFIVWCTYNKLILATKNIKEFYLFRYSSFKKEGMQGKVI